MTFTERIRYVAGERPFAWAASHGIPKANMTVWLGGARPQRKTLVMLEEKTGIPVEWWMNGEIPPPGESGAVQAYPAEPEPTAPVRAEEPRRGAGRINQHALAAILEGALKTAPNASPAAIAEHCAKIYAEAIDSGLITEDGVGLGKLDAAA